MDQKDQTEWSRLSDLVAEHAKRNGGRIPHTIFHTLGRIFGTNPIELVVFRVRAGVVELLYIQRPASDHEFQGSHFPGTIQRTWVGAYETTDDTMKRLIAEELGEHAEVPTLFKLGEFEHVVPPRGMQCAKLYIGELRGEPKEGYWRPLDEPPQDLLTHHREKFLPAAQTWLRERYT